MSTHWSARANCKNMNGESFFPFPGDHAAELRYTVCGKCPVTEDCLESALDSPLRPSGVWGGRTEADVQRMWAERKAQARRLVRARKLGLELAGAQR